jgi:hypothetical protein
VVRAVDFLDEVETFSHFTVDRVVGQAAEEARQGQADVARILGLAEGFPLGVFDGIEHLARSRGLPSSV